MSRPKLSVVSLFSGVGMQEMGIKNCDLFDVEVLATCDLDNYATIAYAAIHNNMTEEMVENWDYPSRSQMADDLIKFNMGYDFKKNKPYDWKKKANGKDKFLNKVWLSCYLNNNLGDICGVKELPECDLLFFSSPCQSFSIAGSQEGINCTCDDCGHTWNPFDIDAEHRDKCPNCGSESIQGTRSGQLAEVERLLVDMKKKNILPKYCFLENVDALVSKKFKPDFDKWCERMENLGYNTYWKVLNGKECGVPQNRKRVFALWIRKDIDTGEFTFPIPFDNGKRLKDVLLPSEEVDEKYYIENDRSKKLIEDLIANGSLKWIDEELCELNGEPVDEVFAFAKKPKEQVEREQLNWEFDSDEDEE